MPNVERKAKAIVEVTKSKAEVDIKQAQFEKTKTMTCAITLQQKLF